MSGMDGFNRGWMTVGTVLENPFATGAERAGQDFGRNGRGGGGEVILFLILLPFIASVLLSMVISAVVSVISFPVVWLGSRFGGRQARVRLFKAWLASAVGLGCAWTAYWVLLLLASWGLSLAINGSVGGGGPVLGAIAQVCQAIADTAVAAISHLAGPLLTQPDTSNLTSGMARPSGGGSMVFGTLVLAGFPIVAHAFAVGNITRAYQGFTGFLAACAVSVVNIALAVLLVALAISHIAGLVGKVG